MSFNCTSLHSLITLALVTGCAGAKGTSPPARPGVSLPAPSPLGPRPAGKRLPARPARPLVNGLIATGSYHGHNTGVHDLGLLAVVLGGRPSAPTLAERCAEMGKTLPWMRVQAGQGLSRLHTTGKAFTNEANRCVAHVPSGRTPAGHFVAVRDLPLEPLGGVTLSQEAQAALQKHALDATHQRTGGVLSPNNFHLRWRHHPVIALGATRWAVLSAEAGALSGCTLPACRFRYDCAPPGGPRTDHTAVVLLRWSGDDDPRRAHSPITVAWLEVRLARSTDSFRGLLCPVGMMVPRGAHAPWLVLHLDECECWSFILVGQEGSAFRTLVKGGGGCTV